MAVGMNIKNALFIAENATVIGDVTIEKDVSIWFGAVVRADRDAISIGAGSNIQDNCVVHTSAGYPVTIGKDVSVGHGAVLHGCTVGNQVLIGMGAVVLNGARIGDGSIIGAGAVVTEGTIIRENSLVLGVPGKVIRETSEEQKMSIIENSHRYRELAERYCNG